MAWIVAAATVVIASDHWWFRLPCAALLVLYGYLIYGTGIHMRSHEMAAWKIETQEVAEGMAMAKDLFTPEDFIKMMKDNPPPGIDPAEWKAGAEEAMRDLHHRPDEP